MNDIGTLRESFLSIVNSGGPMALYDASIIAVDSGDYTCTILLDEEEFYEVRLRAIISNRQSVDILPEVGSQVIVGKIGAGDYIVLSCDKITSYRVSVGDTSLTIDASGIGIKKASETMNLILNEIIDQMLKIYAPKDVAGIALIKTRINDLLK